MTAHHVERDISNSICSESEQVRYLALKELTGSEQVEKVKETLLEICRGDCWGPNRSGAVRKLGMLWPDEEVYRAFEICLDAEPYVANTVIELLATKLDAPAVELFRNRYVTSENSKLRYNILQAFCKADNEVARGFILATRSHADEDERLRALSLSLLAREQDANLQVIFVERLQDESQRVRAGAVEALSAICSPEEILSLLPPYLEDSSNRVRANAVIPLLKTGYRKAETVLSEMVTHGCDLFRSSAAYVLGQLHPTREVYIQLDSLRQDRDPRVRNRARASAERLAMLTPATESAQSSSQIRTV